MEYMELINLIAEKKESDWDKVHYAIDEGMERLKKYDPSCYESVMNEIGAVAYHICDEKAREIVRSMRPYGEKWSQDVIRDFVRAKGITENCVSWYLVMNMAYNDYHDTAAMVGMSEDAEFYYSIANNFINDIDGKKYKVAKYFLDR